MITLEENQELVKIATRQDANVWAGKIGFDWGSYARYKKAQSKLTFLQWSNNEKIR
jgi:hypothetical protein